ncbi:class II aldolase/adducin family protein [Herbiconiux sp. CPCC 203407]|uniref:Class II aldolase/adducin family protein n=1 Tax=Herbiconiux oxytropis TaxID=2970915 RepID=A0AA42BRS9_9MICO|nr:class II aldolase/adducin family protein [Herbiconiux oxytropis]MCS5721443.1 class II aldolase/adducin family protein [Herbiconiux oxytropis]MCS5724520.1 class II aldolase/adducin family protein [Herbiconiux oxytropis]
MTDLDGARSSLVEVGRMLSAAGLSPGSTGNLSIRVGDRIVCTPTGSRLSALETDRLSVIDLDGAVVSGPRATKETFMHRAMYGANPSFGAVVHLHSAHATAVSCLADGDPRDAVLPLTPYLTMRAGAVRSMPYVAPGDPAAAAPIARAVGEGASALLLQNHGSLVAAQTLDDAAAVAEELEESCRLVILTAGLAVRPLSPSQRVALMHRGP